MATHLQSNFSIECVQLNALNRNPLHVVPRPMQIEALAQSIRVPNFHLPIFIDASKRVLAGDVRLHAAQLLGLPQVPTVRLEDLPKSSEESR